MEDILDDFDIRPEEKRRILGDAGEEVAEVEAIVEAEVVEAVVVEVVEAEVGAEVEAEVGAEAGAEAEAEVNEGTVDEEKVQATVKLPNSPSEVPPPVNAESAPDAGDGGAGNANMFAAFAFGGAAAMPVAPPKPKSKPKPKPSPKEKTKSEEFVPVTELPEEKKREISKKWMSMASPTSSVKDRRFQVLFAARLHARTQEPIVRAAMKDLFEHFGDITAAMIAETDGEDLAALIPHVHYGPSKAQQLVKASVQILNEFHGHVPSTRAGLLLVHGIGVKFADLLSFVNTDRAHQQYLANHELAMVQECVDMDKDVEEEKKRLEVEVEEKDMLNFGVEAE